MEKKTTNMGKYQRQAYLRRKAVLKQQEDDRIAERAKKLEKMIADNTPLNNFDMARNSHDHLRSTV
jgi:hypothetical protein